MIDDDAIGQIYAATVNRVEPYGLYLSFVLGEAIVLIPDVSHQRVPDLTQAFRVGESVRVKIVEYVEDRRLYKGTMKDLIPVAAKSGQ